MAIKRHTKPSELINNLLLSKPISVNESHKIFTNNGP